MEFKPFNWYAAGLKSTIEYYNLALQYEHQFNIVISKTLQNNNEYYINGKCMFSNELCDFETVITKNFKGNTWNHEGDFTMNYNGVIYRIDTNINNKTNSDTTQCKFTKDPINIINFDLPKDVVKMAMLVLHLEI
jgi:hypothetical protein